MRFTAIDFETANDRRDSACAVAVAVVEGGKITETRSWLIRPEPLEFNGLNVMIHGISESDVRNKPVFSGVWSELHPYIDGRLIIAHNAGFDIGVLRRLLSKYSLQHQTLNYFCTRAFSKLVYPGQASYSLPLVAEWLGIEFKHHDPSQDATACARVALQCCKELGSESIEAALASYSIRCGEIFIDGYQSWRYPTAAGIHPRDLTSQNPDMNPSHPFYGRMVVFTGTLQSMVRAAAMQAVVNAGGTCSVSLTKKAHYLVVGDQDFTKFRGGEKSAKMIKAEQLLAKGVDIEIVPESEFIRML